MTTTIRTIIALSLVYCQLSYAAPPSGGVTIPKCNPNNSSTVDQVASCAVSNVSPTNLFQFLLDFQNITNANPDPSYALFGTDLMGISPPGSRDAGTAGDVASVDYMMSKLKSFGYTVTKQSYPVDFGYDLQKPTMDEVGLDRVTITRSFVPGSEFSSAQYSGNADVTAPIQTILPSRPTATPSALGCAASDFAGFVPGNIALLQRGTCANRTKVLNAMAAGAVGVITMNYDFGNAGNTLASATGVTTGITVPVMAYIDLAAGQALWDYATSTTGASKLVHELVNATIEKRTTFNVIAESPFGNPNSVIVIGAHYDSIFGAGIVDNASGTVSIMEIARVLAQTPTPNKLRIALWGGEEEGLFGSNFYINTLSSADLNKINYYYDLDDTATNNYSIILDDPAYAIAHPSGVVAPDVKLWKNNAVNLSAVGLGYIKTYLASHNLGYTSRLADLYVSGTDADPFLLAGIPIAGLATGQAGGKTADEVAQFGGTAGNWDFCADSPYIFCDNICNSSYYTKQMCGTKNPYWFQRTFGPWDNPHTIVTQVSADSAVRLLFNTNLGNNGQHTATGQTSSGQSKHWNP